MALMSRIATFLLNAAATNDPSLFHSLHNEFAPPARQRLHIVHDDRLRLPVFARAEPPVDLVCRQIPEDQLPVAPSAHQEPKVRAEVYAHHRPPTLVSP